MNEEKLKNDLVEVYTYNFKKATESNRESKDPEVSYQIGKYDGAVEAMEAIMLQVFGGQAMYEIWQKTLEWANGGEDARRNE